MAENLLTPEQRQQVEELLSAGLPDRLKRRAQVLLGYDDGHPTREVANSTGLSRGRTRYWRRQFWSRGMAILSPPGRTAHPSPALEGNPMDSPTESPEIPTAPAVSLQDDQPPEPAQALPERAEIFEEAPPAVQPSVSQSSQEIFSGYSPSPDFLDQFKSLKSAGVQPDDTIAEAGRKVLRFHFIEMLRHEAGTRLGEDIEELHDMRVATRRMRAAFEIFGEAFKPRALKNRLKGLRATGRALGRARDLDVFIEKAYRYLDGLPSGDRQGLGPILQIWEQEKAAARDQMVVYLDSPNYLDFKEKFYAFVSTPGAGALPAGQAHSTPTLVKEIAPVLIYTRLGAVRSFAGLLHSASIEELHELRIEFKKLRYTFEFFREVLGPEIKAVINDLKGLQDHLGDLNDAQVATMILSQFLTDWDPRQASLPIGERKNPEPVVAYLAYQHAERYRLMTTFGEAWACFDRPEFRRNLALAVSVL
jgi:CHAD domain-containing protein